mmetsp:Transcript_120501/g.239844  ORF Transcript_120501/g.239844 Transcript_120501/m.239844 type:complete len:407 (-) Transcript_120501:76-1296(-)
MAVTSLPAATSDVGGEGGADDRGDSDDSSDLSSCSSKMGRQMTEVSEVQCGELMERQYSSFRGREGDFWKRQCTTPALRQNQDCMEGLRRQISAPSPHGSHLPPFVGGVARIQEEMSSESSGLTGSRQITEISDMPPDDGLLEAAIRTVVTNCNFSVACADPTSMDVELIAVSDGFVRLSGYEREEVLGENCRFLSEGCDIPERQRQQLVTTVNTGEPFVGVLRNRRKCGEEFLNLLDLRGLVIARRPESGEDIWVLMAVQLDVTGTDPQAIPGDHLSLQNQVAGRIRRQMVKQLGELGLSCAMRSVSNGGRGVKGCSWSLTLGTCWRTSKAGHSVVKPDLEGSLAPPVPESDAEEPRQPNSSVPGLALQSRARHWFLAWFLVGGATFACLAAAAASRLARRRSIW